MAIFGAVFWVHIVDPYNISCNYSGFVLQLRWRHLMEPKNLPRRKKRCDFWTFIEFILKLKATPFHSFKIKCFASTLWRWLIFIHTMRTNRCSGGSRGREGPGKPGLPLIFRPNWGPKGWKNFFETWAPPYLRVWMTPLPPYLMVWIRHCGVRLVSYAAVFSVVTQCPSRSPQGPFIRLV